MILHAFQPGALDSEFKTTCFFLSGELMEVNGKVWQAQTRLFPQWCTADRKGTLHAQSASQSKFMNPKQHRCISFRILTPQICWFILCVRGSEFSKRFEFEALFFVYFYQKSADWLSWHVSSWSASWRQCFSSLLLHPTSSTSLSINQGTETFMTQLLLHHRSQPSVDSGKAAEKKKAMSLFH